MSENQLSNYHSTQGNVANLVTRLDYNGFYGQYLDLSQINDAGVSNLNSSSIL